MAARHYLAVIERAAEGFGVFFPDLPGCTSGGATVEEAAVNAEEALRGHVEVSVEEGQALPAPSPLSDVEVDPDVDEVVRMLVRVDMPGAAVRVNITVPDDVLAAVDRHVEQQGFTRSGFFAQAAQEKMRRERGERAGRLGGPAALAGALSKRVVRGLLLDPSEFSGNTQKITDVQEFTVLDFVDAPKVVSADPLKVQVSDPKGMRPKRARTNPAATGKR